MIFSLLAQTSDLPAALALGALVIGLTLLYRFHLELFDWFGVSGTVRRLFDKSWAGFEDSLDQSGVEQGLKAALRRWAERHHPRTPLDLLNHRRDFERFVETLVSDPDFEAHPNCAARLEQLQKLRQRFGLRPVHGEILHSSRELDAGCELTLSANHPDFEVPRVKSGVTVQIKSLNDLEMTLEPPQDEDWSVFEEFRDRQMIWVRFIHGQTRHRFQARLRSDGAKNWRLHHGRFLIREKRGDPRIPHQHTVTIYWQEGESSRQTEVESVDVSRSGIAFVCDNLVPLKTLLQFDLPVADNSLEDLQAEILDISPNGDGRVRLHCRFFKISTEDVEQLDDLVIETLMGAQA